MYGVLCSIFISFMIGIVPEEKIDVTLKEEELLVIFLPMQEGSAVLIKDKKNQSILVDLGGTYRKEELVYYLSMYKIKMIDTAIILEQTDEKKMIIDQVQKDVPMKELVFPAEQNEIEICTDIFFDHLHLQFIDSGIEKKHIRLTYGDHHFLFLNKGNISILEKLVTEKPIELVFLHESLLQSSFLESFVDNNDTELILFHSKKQQKEIVEMMREKWIEIYNIHQTGHVVVKCTKDTYDLIFVQTKWEGK
ncbi:hypothetical protein [Massilibacterium senegalense]|uniref:hypothetical protein n=1 Tax=Massilibacterium senegalense TaxID=1632858 RepID=UPI000781BFC1|nr:hypothetical protein [Massilibacterium senegalense]